MAVDIPIEELRQLASYSGHGARQSTKRTSRLRLGLLIAGLVAVAALLGWQHRIDEVNQMVGLWSSSLVSLWPASLMDPSRVPIVETQTISAPQADAPSPDGSEQGAGRTAGADRAARTAGDIEHQLQSIAHDLIVLKEDLEQLAAKQAQLAVKQEHMVRDIAALSAIKPDDKLTTASTPPARGVIAAPRKKPSLLPPPPSEARPLYPEQTPSALPRPDVGGRPATPSRQ